MIIKNISLISENEYNCFVYLITPIGKPYWTRSNGETEGYQLMINDTRKPHMRYYDALPISERGVRPTLTVENVGNWKEGDVIEIFGFEWVVLLSSDAECYVFCNSSIASRCFDRMSREWPDSALRHWLREWATFMAKGVESVEVAFN